MRVAGFVLTGGASQRMGRDKALLPFRGTVLADWVARQVRAAADGVWLVGEPDRYRRLPWPRLGEQWPGRGPLSGIEAGLREVGAEWNLVVACDAAGVRGFWLAELAAAALASTGADIVAAASADHGEPLCALYHQRTLPAVQAALAGGRYAVRDLLATVRTSLWHADWVAGLRNVNTPEDWALVEAGE
jgi:molybdopterin-guanine dinucleotide biosynthesis protein A